MITNTKTSRLAGPEREEVIEIIREARGRAFGTGRFQRDRDTLAGYLVLSVAGTFGIIAFLVVFGLEDLRFFWSGLPTSIGPQSAAQIGFHAAIVVTPWAIWRLVTRWNRAGYILTSFGIARLRGDNLRLVRFPDIARVVRTRGRRYALVEIATRDGTVMSTYASALFDSLAKQLPPGATSSG